MGSGVVGWLSVRIRAGISGDRRHRLGESPFRVEQPPGHCTNAVAVAVTGRGSRSLFPQIFRTGTC